MDFLSENRILASKSEARRAIINKGIKIDDVVVSDLTTIIEARNFKNKSLKISFGKKKHYLIKIT